ncbi:cell adhesion molecule 2-like [Planococcus citri]|uniref:cell adhesion molecule 2-like n=1 Tax=Planococcus citri TaxID=170843 RepID=UPI0031F90865
MNAVVNNDLILAVITLLLSFSAFPESRALRLIKVVVPEYIYVNKPASLECQYDLENDKLYTVQWYKDNDEFYRYVPKYVPPHISYRIDDIKVDISNSNDKKVSLKNVSLMMRGVYRCEVSAEAPSFATVYGEARMEVIALPKEDPHINGEEKAYQVGDTINLTCTSGKSYPPAQLRWFINGREIKADYHTVHEHNGLHTVMTGLILKAGQEHFVDGQIQIKCQATISVGNHSLITLPAHHSNVATTSSKFGYQRDALISVRGSSTQVASVSPYFIFLLICKLLYEIT